MGLRGIAKRASKTVTKPLDKAKDYGSRVIDQGRTLANTKGTSAQRFSDSPGGFSAYLPKPARTAVGFLLPKPRDVVNAYRKDGTSGFIEQAKVNLQIATAPLAGAGIARGGKAAARGASAFARAPRVAGIMRAASSELGAARVAGGKLRTAADLAMSRAPITKSTPGASLAAANAAIDAAVAGVPRAAAKPATAVVSRAGSTLAARSAGRAGNLIGKGISTVAREAYAKPIQNIAQGAARIKNASGIAGRARATAAAAGHTPGLAFRLGAITAPVTAAAAGAVLETKNTIQGKPNVAVAGQVNTPQAKGLRALAEGYRKSDNPEAYRRSLIAGLYKAEGEGLSNLVNDNNSNLMKMYQEGRANKFLQKKVKEEYAVATRKRDRKPISQTY